MVDNEQFLIAVEEEDENGRANDASVLYSIEEADEYENARSYDEKKLENMLMAWKDKASMFSRYHDLSSRYFKRCDKMLAIPILVLTSVVGTVNLSEAPRSCENKTASTVDYLQMSMGILSVLSASIAAMHHFLQLPARHKSHQMYAGAYEKLARSIEVHVLLANSDNRVYNNLPEFLKECQDGFDALTDTAPHIPGFILLKNLSN
jgi:hypothetical protein